MSNIDKSLSDLLVIVADNRYSRHERVREFELSIVVFFSPFRPLERHFAIRELRQMSEKEKKEFGV